MTHQRAAFASVASALIAFGALVWVAVGNNGGVFEYPLDDVYIHLAMAEQIAAGGYGVNAGEFASAASSPLYPLLLTAFPGTELQRLLPLFWNIVGLVGAAWFWARIVITAGYFEAGRALIGWSAVLIGPVFINSFGVAYTGMEHSLHMAAALAVIYGLQRLVVEQRLTAPLLIGLFLVTALRLEGLALGVLTTAVVFWILGLRAALICAALTILPVLAFVGVLTGIGLDPLPESVQAKLKLDEDEAMGPIAGLINGLRINLAKPAGLLLAIGGVVMLALLSRLPRATDTGPRLLALAVSGAVFAHLLFGQIGWMDRYEGYIWASLAAGLLVVAAKGPRLLQAGILGGIVAGAAVVYGPSWTQQFPWNIRAIYVQPIQSARFAQDFVKAPVAVNDLGRVSWGNPDYVLDLYGLASAEARALRLGGAPDGWAAPLVQAKDVKLVMIYDAWLANAVGPDWVRLGWLRFTTPPQATSAGYLGDYEVAYYATSPAFVPELEAALAAWKPTLPDGAYFVAAD